MLETLVVLTSLFLPQAAIAQGEKFAEPFQGWYAFLTPTGEKVEALAIVPDGVAAVCTGSSIDRTWVLRYRGWHANIAMTDDKEVFCVVCSPTETKIVCMTKFEKPLVIYNGQYSRPLPR